MNWLIGQSHTFPTTIYVRANNRGQIQISRLTEHEKLTTAQLKDLSNEILLQRKLRSTHIVRILGSKVVGSRICVDTEYCQFGSISDIISAHFQHGLDLQAVSLIARGVALGLDYLHSNEIVHRSLRGSHILVNSKGVVKLSGFRYSIDLTRQREKKKSFKYVYDPEGLPWLAPEILEQNCCGFGLLSDMYSFGIVLCELLNGIVPFSNNPATLIMLDKLRGRQPVVMDKSTMEDVENAYQDPVYEPYVTRKIPKVWHLLVSSLTTRAPEKRLTAKAFLRNNGLKFTQGTLVEKLLPVQAMTLNHLRNNDPDYFPITDEIREPSFEQAKWIFSN
ncbi:Oidioi.mRNA.OKI2018_I69.chr2.g6402.t1.cds [Oikopleura dioica]|uniref:Oidioi.mRNA.OKI2018_I69.chr2.g6402.t1.cds n=1 Tax=Oikopleura dioica TaxID=34765 RepID=A0ABN7T9Z9_OIKDI|nr:Oidioi.mRNA.OKI2018_I69.chr2.g6402.t1.cds [Oikopleura dioica]